MIRKTIPIKLKEGQICWIAPFNDVHYNTEECDKFRFRRYIKWGAEKLVKGDRLVGIGLGDYDDSISPSERASVVSAKGGYGYHDTTLKQMDAAAKNFTDTFAAVLAPWKGNIAGLLEGHHFMVFSALAKDNLRSLTTTEYLCRLMDTDYLGKLAHVTLDFGHGLHLKILATHGYGGARTPGARVTKRVRMSEVARAHLYLMGHDNEKVAKSQNILDMVDGHYIAVPQMYCGTGSFQRSYPIDSSVGGYVEELLLPPSDLGPVVTEVELEKRNGRWRLECRTSLQWSLEGNQT